MGGHAVRGVGVAAVLVVLWGAGIVGLGRARAVSPLAAAGALPIRETLAPAPLYGNVFAPSGPGGPWPGVVVLNGSEGYAMGVSARYAAMLAQYGFVAFALCYFGCPGRPQQLRDIALEYEFAAVRYLDGRADVRRGDVTVLGGSRGGELALLVGAYDPEPRAVVAFFGAPQVHGAYPGPGTAWTLGGRPLPLGAMIPVTRIRGPVLLFVGRQDKLWPYRFSVRVADELDAAHHPNHLTVYPDAGHAFDSAALLQHQIVVWPTAEYGGTLAGNERADANSLAQTVAFLRGLTPAYAPGPP